MRFVILFFLLLLPVAVTAQVTGQPDGTIAVEDSATQDAAIAVRIRNILGELDGFENVTVTVSSGIVTLRGTTLDSSTAFRLSNIAARVQGVVAIENEVIKTTDVVERLNPAAQRFVERANQFIAYLPLAAVAVVAFVTVVFVGFLIARLKSPWDRIAPNAFIADIYRQLLRLAFIVAALVVALDILGATALLSTILGAAGIVGLAIGFAVKDTVENFIASIMLSIRQPFRPNDTIQIDGDIGKVIRLTSRATILLSFDGNHIRIPNATVFKSRIVNYSRNDERRFVFDLCVAYGTDLAMARQLASETLRGLPFVLKVPAPDVWISELGDSTVSLRLAGWIAQNDTSFARARGEAMRLSLAAFDAAGIEMPEPTYRLRTDSAAVEIDPKPLTMSPVIPEAEVQIEDVQIKAEIELERMVNEERQELQDGDLLKREAPEE
ncbi:MAG: mechanosensitive ion channel family protein [Paracoccaceae bacterium]